MGTNKLANLALFDPIVRIGFDLRNLTQDFEKRLATSAFCTLLKHLDPRGLVIGLGNYLLVDFFLIT